VADVLLAKLGGDSLAELQAALRRAWQRARLLEGHVFLCGLPGSGKSTVGPLLAAKLGMPFVDLDRQIERAAGRSIPDIFAAEQEAGFRAREAAALRAAATGPRSLVALGGGAVTSRGVRHWIRRTGHMVWLRAPAEVCASRAPTGRPLLGSDPAGRIAQLAAEREPLYARLADAVVDVAGLRPEQVAAQCAAAVHALEA
jgi:shikimate kinase